MNALPKKLVLLLAAATALTAGALAALHAPGFGPVLASSPLGPLVCAFSPTLAIAQELEFEPVPAESVSEFERRRARAREAARAARGTVVEVRDRVRSQVGERVRVELEAQQGAEPGDPDVPVPPEGIGVVEDPRTVTLTSKSGNITRIGSDIVIGPDQVVVGDVVAVGGDVTVEGRVEGDVAAMGGDVHLTSTANVEGDVVCMGGRLVEDEGAQVGGQRVSGLGSGSRVTVRSGDDPAHAGGRDDRGGDIGGALFGVLMMLGATWAFAGLGGGRTHAAAETLRRAPLLSAGIGALVFALIVPSLVALALVVALLCITIIGIPVALAALLAYFLFHAMVWVWGYVVAASVVGGWLLGRRATPAVAGAAPAAPSVLRSALFGVLILSGAGFVGRLFQNAGPLGGLGTLLVVLSWIAFALAVAFGSGAWIRSELETGALQRWWRGRGNQWGRSKSAGEMPPMPAGAAPTAPGQAYPAPPYPPPPYAPPTPYAPQAPYAPPSPYTPLAPYTAPSPYTPPAPYTPPPAPGPPSPPTSFMPPDPRSGGTPDHNG